MNNKWILDVLADLKAFADENDLGELSKQLELTSSIAAAEIGARPGKSEASRMVYGDGRDIARHSGKLAGGRSA
ncbi:hypothetical protein [Oceanicola granulosus]|uniref:hypothetical protein n=1 Tax=Oceanicola granulosus TaxID=252302 RepID=UPI00178C6FC2|nr:hypothetical protein [Oceanicola granulosus]